MLYIAHSKHLKHIYVQAHLLHCLISCETENAVVASTLVIIFDLTIKSPYCYKTVSH